MPQYLIEVTHGDEHEACVMALRAIEQYGSHLMTHADWGCKDDIHQCWLVCELDTREEAMQLVPPEFRTSTRVVALNKFTKEDIAILIEELET
jgi:hypothetical protein